MAEHAKHDGRFGAQFDDEINGRGIIVTIVSVLAILAFAIVAMLALWRYLEGARETPAVAATPRLVAEALAIAEPPSPRLQPDPEGELVSLRREMAQRLHSYGWVDEAGGIVHIPIEQAITLVLERGLPGGGSVAEEGAHGS